MKKHKKILNFISVTFIALIGCVVIFVIYVKPDQLSSKTRTSVQNTVSISPEANHTLQDSIVNFGLQYLGTPYVAAGCGPDGFDCSGFVNYVFKNFDIDIPRSSAQFEHFGTEIRIEDVQKGDLLLFLSPTRNAIGHIGIVSEPNGMNSDFIHASSGREMKVIITSLSNEGYTRRFVKAIRVL